MGIGDGREGQVKTNRRDFLRMIAGVAAALLVPKAARAEPEPVPDSITLDLVPGMTIIGKDSADRPSFEWDDGGRRDDVLWDLEGQGPWEFTVHGTWGPGAEEGMLRRLGMSSCKIVDVEILNDYRDEWEEYASLRDGPMRDVAEACRRGSRCGRVWAGGGEQ